MTSARIASPSPAGAAIGRPADGDADLGLAQQLGQRGDDDRAGTAPVRLRMPPITSIATIRKVRSR